MRQPSPTINEYAVCLAERRRVPMIEDFFRCAAEIFELPPGPVADPEAV